MALAVGPATGTIVKCILVCTGVYHAPKCSTKGWHHSNNAPVRSKVLHAPDHGDYDWGQGEGAPVAETDEGGGEVEEWWLLQGKGGGENQVAD